MDLKLNKLYEKWNNCCLLFSKDIVVINLRKYYNSESDLFINKLISELEINDRVEIDLTNDKKYIACCIGNLTETMNEWIINNEINSDFWLDYYKKN